MPPASTTNAGLPTLGSKSEAAAGADGACPLSNAGTVTENVPAPVLVTVPVASLVNVPAPE